MTSRRNIVRLTVAQKRRRKGGGPRDLPVGGETLAMPEPEAVPTLFGYPIASRWTWERLLRPIKELVT
jgi:hypothetical protein